MLRLRGVSRLLLLWLMTFIETIPRSLSANLDQRKTKVENVSSDYSEHDDELCVNVPASGMKSHDKLPGKFA